MARETSRLKVRFFHLIGIARKYLCPVWMAHIHYFRHNQIFFIPFKLIQQSNMVILSCLARKNQNLNARKKSSVYFWKVKFVGISALKTQLSVINWTFFSLNSNFKFFFERQLRRTILDCCISLKMVKKNLTVLGVLDMRQLLLSLHRG